ncbi:aromatic acid decarboxylase, partial [Streptomyces sp. SID6648]|nr:aromatic acid decarboxylase [Streptomyces sp. SID6648]
MSTPRTVDRAFEAALYDTSDDALDTAASLLAADPAADADLLARGEEFVATAWRRGWQPADLVRIVRRELDDVHVRLVAALIRSRAPHDGPRGPRWAAQ